MNKKSIILFTLVLVIFLSLGFYISILLIDKSDNLVKESTPDNTTYITSIDLNHSLNSGNFMYNDQIVEVTGEVVSIDEQNKELLIKGSPKNIKVKLQNDQDLNGIEKGSFIAVKGIAVAPKSQNDEILLKSSVIEVR